MSGRILNAMWDSGWRERRWTRSGLLTITLRPQASSAGILTTSRSPTTRSRNMNRPIRGLVGAVLLLHGFARSEVDQTAYRSDGNHVIPERNAFGLKATTPTRAAGETVEPL